MDPRKCRKLLWILPFLFGLAACGGDDTAVLPSIEIETPTSLPAYATDNTAVRLGGTIARASFVRVVNNATGISVSGYVNYVDGYGSWFADVYGLVPGDNFLVVTADADGTGTRTSTDAITVTLPPGS